MSFLSSLSFSNALASAPVRDVAKKVKDVASVQMSEMDVCIF